MQRSLVDRDARARLASLHADADAAGAAADRARRRRLPLHRGRPADARRHLVVVGQHPRALASALNAGAGRAGARARARRSSPAARTGRPSSSPSGCSTCCRAADARLLLGQRIDGRRGRAEDGRASTGATAASRGGSASSRCTTRITATRSARCRSSEDSVFTRPFASMLFHVERAHAPYCYRCPLGLDRATCDIECLGRSRVETARALDGDDAPRCIVEPMLQGAGGMIVWPAEFLAGVRRLCDRLRRADDRRRSAHRIRPHRPDVRLRARGGHARHHLPVEGAHRPATCRSARRRRPTPSTTRSSATIARRTFFHGHSFTANPLACAVAIASLDLFAEQRRARADRAARALAARAASRRSRAADRRRRARDRRRRHRRARQRQGDEGGRRLPGRTSGRGCRAAFLERGLLLRPLGNVLYFMPPYVIQDDEVDWVIGEIATVLESISAN